MTELDMLVNRIEVGPPNRDVLDDAVRMLPDLAKRLREAEGNAARWKETAENYLGHCEAACKQVDSLEAERDALLLDKARLVEALELAREYALPRIRAVWDGEAQSAERTIDAALASSRPDGVA